MARILVVDDDSALLMLAQTVLTRAGHEALVTSKPLQVVSLVENEAIDAVVLDVMMPERDGFEVLTDLRARPSTSKVVVLMLSTLGKGPDRVKGLRHGACDYLTKPLEPEELLLKLDRLLSAAAADSLQLNGSHEYFPLVEIIQSRHDDSCRDGRLSMTGSKWVERKRSTGWREQSDDEALWSMLGQDGGRPRFCPPTADDARSESQLVPGNPTSSVQTQPESSESSAIPLASGIMPTSEDRRFLIQVQKKIEDRLGDGTLTVEALAEELAVHRSQLYRRLLELTGLAPNQLILYLRLERASALLKTGAATVSAIAHAVGFQSFAHFSRRFKERFGQTPTEAALEAGGQSELLRAAIDPSSNQRV